MALFIDGAIPGIEDLTEHDTAILDLASTEGINLTTKLALAKEELGVELTALLRRTQSNDLLGCFQSQIGLENIAVTAPLRLWHTFLTLSLSYRDAYNNQLNDRYMGKWKEYKKLSRWASGMLMQTGLGIVSNPLPQAESPKLSFVPGPQPAQTYYVKTSWRNGDEEGAAGYPASITVPDGNLLRAKPLNQPANAKGWNVYVGFSPEDLFLQNETPIELDQDWTQASSGLNAGRRPGNGQEPNYLRSVQRLLQRG